MPRFSSPEQAQRFLSAHAAIYNPFSLRRHLVSAAFYRFRRAHAFAPHPCGVEFVIFCCFSKNDYEIYERLLVKG